MEDIYQLFIITGTAQSETNKTNPLIEFFASSQSVTQPQVSASENFMSVIHLQSSFSVRKFYVSNTTNHFSNEVQNFLAGSGTGTNSCIRNFTDYC